MSEYVKPKKKSSISQVTYAQRVMLEKLLAEGAHYKTICEKTNMTRSTMYHERRRMGSIEIPYKADVAHKNMLEKVTYRNDGRSYLPISHKKAIVTLYKDLQSVMKEAMSAKTKFILKKAILELERMGADPSKMKKPLSEGDKTEIIKLWQEGKSIKAIEVATGRSRSTITSYLDQYKQQPEKENEYERLKNRWLD